MGLGYLEGVTHDYIRHGTTTLFAAPNAARGEVIAQCRSRHRHQEFLAFLKHVDQAVPEDLDGHLIVDNYAIGQSDAANRPGPPKRRHLTRRRITCMINERRLRLVRFRTIFRLV